MSMDILFKLFQQTPKPYPNKVFGSYKTCYELIDNSTLTPDDKSRMWVVKKYIRTTNKLLCRKFFLSKQLAYMAEVAICEDNLFDKYKVNTYQVTFDPIDHPDACILWYNNTPNEYYCQVHDCISICEGIEPMCDAAIMDETKKWRKYIVGSLHDEA